MESHPINGEFVSSHENRMSIQVFCRIVILRSLRIQGMLRERVGNVRVRIGPRRRSLPLSRLSYPQFDSS